MSARAGGKDVDNPQPNAISGQFFRPESLQESIVRSVESFLENIEGDYTSTALPLVFI